MLERQGHWQLLSHGPSDPKLSKSSPSGIPLLANQSATGDWLSLQRQFSKPLAFISIVPLGVISTPRAIAHPTPHRSRFWRPHLSSWRPGFHTSRPSPRGSSIPESGVTLTGAPKPLSSKPALSGGGHGSLDKQLTITENSHSTFSFSFPV